MVCLKRFDFDWEHDKRYKINDRFEFGLELDMSPFTENGENFKYELQTILIHRGGAYGGHYHAFIRDIYDLGQWEDLKKKVD